MPLGSIAFKAYFDARRQLGWKNPSPLPKFGHGLAVTLPDGITVISSYHPSQQNTQTGKLTEAMLDDVFRQVRERVAIQNEDSRTVIFGTDSEFL